MPSELQWIWTGASIRESMTFIQWVMQKEMRAEEPNPLHRAWWLLRERFFLPTSNLFLTMF